MSTDDIEVGDVVRIGKGKRLWRVQSFWTAKPTGVTYAALGPTDTVGYSTTSANPDRLTIVTKTAS